MSFESRFGVAPQVSAQAPGRVNLMGEHTDYNQGWVLPSIVPQRTTVQIAIAPNAAEDLDAFSVTCQDRMTRSLHDAPQGHWTDYVLACLQQLCHRQIQIPSLKLWIDSTLPMGAGLASSAALEVAVLKALRSLLRLDLTDLNLALIAQQAENEGVGMPCGVMDQMVSALGQPYHAFWLDTQTLSFAQIPLPGAAAFVVVHSGASHTLVSSGYKQRRQECEAAAAWLQVSSLRESTVTMLEQPEMPPLLQRRVRHVVTENQRVFAMVRALQAERMTEAGQLMNASHVSQQQAFEVTVPATDHLWQMAVQQGALGARQTGGGFGGAIVALVPVDAVASWWQKVAKVAPQAHLIAVIHPAIAEGRSLTIAQDSLELS